ncbi:MAG: hypothetical protein KBG15_18680 [Kofleriaceae bacterium]|nr:hypothetical protein [Kofleriaceae bacterium]
MKKAVALLAMIMMAVGCGGGPKKSVEKADDVAAETCCCKWTPLVSDDAKAKFATENRMECSGKQGECVAEMQCNSEPEPEATPAP